MNRGNYNRCLKVKTITFFYAYFSFCNIIFSDLNDSKAKSSQEIDKEFDKIINYIEARRKVLKTQLEEKSKVQQ